MPWYLNVLIALAVLVVPFVVGMYLARKFRMPDHGWKMGLVLFCVVGSIAVVATGSIPLGIDLSGGVILVYEVDQNKKTPGQDVDMEKLIAAISLRVNPGGYREVKIRQYGLEQVEITIPRADEAEMERIKKIISSAGTLEFRILANERDDKSLIDQAKQREDKIIYDAMGNRRAWWVPVNEKEEADFQRGGGEIAVRTVKDSRGKDVLEVLVKQDDFNVNGGFLSNASAGLDQRGQRCVEFSFTSAGGRLFGGLTASNLPDEVQDFSRRLGIILNDQLFSAPNIKSTIFDRGEITGSFSKQEVDDLVRVLNAGALPAALTTNPVAELLTGATLGADMIEKGALATALSVVLVLLFMLVYYRSAGVIACFAMLLNGMMIVAIMIVIHAELSLPGFAGLVLSVGMAVDANVLIYERMREELDRNAGLRMAIRNGFDRALSAIVDSNLTTLITATVLYVVGTDQIKGFAVTLWLGVVLSMFTGVFCSRVVFDVCEKQKWMTRLSMMRMLTRTNIDFLGARRLAISASAALILVGLAASIYRGVGLFDIDLTGGVSVQIVFDDEHRQEITDVRKALAYLPDLAVADVQLRTEEPGTRFLVNTSQQAPVDPDTEKVLIDPQTGAEYTSLDYVEQRITETFKGKLATNSLVHQELSRIEPAEKDAPAAKTPAAKADGAKPAAESGAKPKTDKQSRSDLPPDSILAMADAPPVLAPADAPAAKPVEKPAEKPVQPAKPQAETEKPAEPAKPQAGTEKPAEKPGPKTAPKAEPKAAAPGDPFVGGTKATLQFADKISHQKLEDLLMAQRSKSGRWLFELSNPEYTAGMAVPFDTWNVKLNLPPESAKAVFEQLDAKLRNSPSFPFTNPVGGQVSKIVQRQAVAALMASLVFIVIYIWVRFQKVVYGLAAVIATVHDLLITVGFVALSHWLASFLGFLLIDDFKIGLTVLAAFLTIIGYSLNDTIVVFDRIREVKGKSPVLTEQMVNDSVNQTLSRTIITGGGALMGLFVMYVFGGQGIHAFCYCMFLGVVVGTFSSVYIASPVLLWLAGSPMSRNEKKREVVSG
jgi:SecD/SecF fusion protein